MAADIPDSYSALQGGGQTQNSSFDPVACRPQGEFRSRSVEDVKVHVERFKANSTYDDRAHVLSHRNGVANGRSVSGGHVRRQLPQIPQSRALQVLTVNEGSNGLCNGNSSSVHYSTASLGRRSKLRVSTDAINVGNATIGGFMAEETRSPKKNHIRLPMFRSASLEQLNEIETQHSPMTPPPALRFKAYQAKKMFQRRRTYSELQQPLVSPADRRRRRNITVYRQQDLLSAIEKNDVKSVATILRDSDININEVNEEGHTPLDVAIMVNSQEIGDLLLKQGAKENPKFYQMEKDFRGHRLEILLSEAERRVTELTGVFVYSTPRTQSQSRSALVQEYETKLRQWESKKQQLQLMKQQYDSSGVPGPPTTCHLRVESSTSLLVLFEAPRDNHGAFITRYKVEWSQLANFSSCESVLLTDTRTLEHCLSDLQTDVPYFVRVSAYNMRGYGPTRLSSPNSLCPSSWHNVDYVLPRADGRTEALSHLFQEMCQVRESGNIPRVPSPVKSPQQTSRKVQRTLSRIFRSSVKFVKNIRRGVYFALLFYSAEGIVLSTVDDQLPIVEVDDGYPSSLMADFQWLLKVGCTWEDIQLLQKESSKASSSSSAHLRHKLMAAVDAMQSAVGLKDLGQLHYEPIRDTQNSVVIVTVSCVTECHSCPSVSLRWAKIGKLTKKQLANSEESSVGMKQVVAAIPQLIAFNQNRQCNLSRGLYLGYLKLEASVDLLQVVVPLDMPSVLPHVKLRDNPNVSKEEWLCLKSDEKQTDSKLSLACVEFVQLLYSKAKELTTKLGVSDDDIEKHHVYNAEVVELSPAVAFILLLPSSDKICTVLGQSSPMKQDTSFTMLPLPLFEMIQWQTYQSELIRLYCRASATLDIDQLLVQHCMREAFSEDEIKTARARQEHISFYLKCIEDVWRGMHWMAEAVQCGRDHQISALCSVASLREQAIARVSCDGELSHKTKRRLPSLDGFPSSELGELRVYPAYDPTLDPNTSVKLHVGYDATAVDIVRAVVERMSQDNEDTMTSSCNFREFCLVAVIGSSERWLRNDFCPLQLQNPWTKGRLFVMKESQQYSDKMHSTFV